MKRHFWPIISIFCLAIGGCANNDVIVRKQVELEGTLERLNQQQGALDARMSEVSQAVKELQQRAKGTEADLDALRPSIDRLKGSVDAVSQKLSEIKSSPPPREHGAEPAAAHAAAKPTGQEAYARAFAVYSQGNLPAALEAFEAFVRAEPGSEFAPNALYWAGECYYKQTKFDAALAAFQRVVTEYPKARKVPDAMLKIGFALVEMKEPVRARTQLHALVEKFPKTPAADKARERLGHL